VRACGAVGGLINRVDPDQWTTPTPCSEWNVRDVVNHLVAGNRVFAALLDGGPMPERAADHVGDDPVAAYQASAVALCDAFGRPGALERSYAGPLGNASGADRLQIRLYDLLTHGWDLAQPRTGRFAEPQPVRDTDPPIEQLAAFLGRQVR
jgi:uncharacterized protein (TIGR03086 family)